MTQMQLAKRLGYSGNSRIADWERGVNIPSPMNIKRLSDLFETDLVQYVDNGVPALSIPVVKVIKQCKNDNLSIVDTIKELEDANLITKENEKGIIKAIMFSKWVIDTSNDSNDLSELDED